MTSQTKKFIELSDIVGMRFECNNQECRAIFLLPMLDGINRCHPLKKCPNCAKGWAVLATDGGVEVGYEATIKQFVDAVKEMQKAKFGFSFMLELKEEPKTHEK
jgi:uncharacterized radical SAM superfamily protein